MILAAKAADEAAERRGALVGGILARLVIDEHGRGVAGRRERRLFRSSGSRSSFHCDVNKARWVLP